MNFVIAFQTFTTGLAGIAIWFIYQLISEYKKFREDVSKDLSKITQERSNYENLIKSASLRFEELKLLTDSSIKVINSELRIFQNQMGEVSGKAEKAVKFMDQAFQLARTINERTILQERELRALKIQLGDLTIFKSGK